MTDRDWSLFWQRTLRSLKYVGISLPLVPIFFLLMNTDYTDPEYFRELLFSFRVGVEIALFYWCCSSLLDLLLIYKNLPLARMLWGSLVAKSVRGLAFMLMGLSLVSLTEPYISGRNFGYSSISVGMLVGGITFLLLLFYGGYQEAKRSAFQLRAEAAEANLHVLKNQMQPHFLFNSLNSLAELIDSKSEGASLMTLKLADLYREILESSKSQLSTVGKEILIVEKYLELEGLRLGSRLQFQITIDRGCELALIPTLVLQTLVENAVKHGIAKLREGGVIEVEITRSKGEGYLAEVRNTGSLEEAHRDGGVGLRNTKSRLSLIYGNRHNFQMVEEEQRVRTRFWFSGEGND